MDEKHNGPNINTILVQTYVTDGPFRCVNMRVNSASAMEGL